MFDWSKGLFTVSVLMPKLAKLIQGVESDYDALRYAYT